jgi:threonylcarbamoyladenosine tRNA methylthiotransferase MtaB
MRIFLSSLGCKLNQAEMEQLGRRFLAAGHQLVGSLGDADLHVLNSCSVTHVAARDSRKLARRGRRLNPGLRTVLTGCYVDSDPDAAQRLAGVDLVVPNRDKDRLLERIQEVFGQELSVPGSVGPVPVPYVPLEFGKARALVKVEDGCNMRCSFCIIPTTRGSQHSRPLPEILDEVRALAACGYREVVITGVQISSYRWQGQGLFELTRTLLEQTEIPRLRLTSIAPWQFDLRLVERLSWRRLCRHIHLSLQSGCSETLRRMRRPYSADEFANLADHLRQRVASIAITTDVIVGFPGESETEFSESLEFSKEMGFARLHAFPYSARSGTEAADLPQQVPPGVKRERMQRMLAVAHESQRRFQRAHVRATAEVLWEAQRNGAWQGMTDNYLRVVLESEDDLAHRITTVRLAEPNGLGLTCELSSPSPL